MSERRRIIDRIRKCLRLSQSPEPNEAAAALRQAQALIAEHGVSEDELRLADVEHRKTTAGRSVIRPPLWLTQLAKTVASAFGVSYHYEVQYDAPCRFVFVGVKPSAEVAEYAFTVLRRKCTAARAVYYRTRRGKRSSRTRKADAYAIGWVFAVSIKVTAFASEYPPVVGQYLRAHFPGLTTMQANNRMKSRDRNDACRGLEDGSSVELQHGMSGASAPARLGDNRT